MLAGALGLETNPDGFTPVRRTLSTINTRQSGGDSEKEWTAARCNRLLRALKSRVAILNKDISRFRSGGQGQDIVIEAKFGTIPKGDNDEDWSQARKRIRRTYSSRAGTSGNCSQANLPLGDCHMLPAVKGARSLIPGEVSVPTPILNRARGELLPSTTCTVSQLQIRGNCIKSNKRARAKDGKTNFPFSETLRSIRKQTPPSTYTIYEGIYNGLEALLKATIPNEQVQKRRGARSLLSLCLGTVPRHIAQEEALLAAHMEETGSKSALDARDISTEIYDDLETFGSCGRGWKQLRTIVRSHGIHVVSDAIRAGSLDVEFVGILVTLCIQTSAAKEAETLLASLFSITNLPGPRSVFTRFGDELATRPLSILGTFVEITGIFSFQYRQLSTMVSDGLLPLGWLASKEFGPIWTRAIQALSTDSPDTDALIFMTNMVPLLVPAAGLGSVAESGLVTGHHSIFEATKQTFSSLLTTISSIVILSKDAAKKIQTESSEPIATEYEHFITLLRNCLMRWELSRDFSIHGTLLLIANLIVGAGSRDSLGLKRHLVDILLDHLQQINTSTGVSAPYREIVTFVCSIARCCGRGSSNSGFEHLLYLHDILETLLCGRVSDGANILCEIVADSAIAFAQAVPDREHLDYSATMEEKRHRITANLRFSSTPRRVCGSSSGFRWEEGISEWVRETTSISTKSKDAVAFSQADDSGYDASIRPPIYRKMGKKVAPRVVGGCGLISSETCSGAINYSNETLTSCYATASSVSGSSHNSEDELVNDSPEIEFSCDARDSGERLVPHSLAKESFHDIEKSENNQRPDSPQSKGSNESNELENELLTRLPRSKGLSMERSAPSSAVSLASCVSAEPSSGRRYIDRAPRLNRRVLRRSLQWQVFEESDDELSFVSVSSQGNSILQEVTNRAGRNTRSVRPTKTCVTQRKGAADFLASRLGDSEDELCI